MTASLRCALAVALLLAWVGSAVAQTAPADPTEAANARVREAAAAYDRGDFARAIVLLEEAYALAPRPATLFNLAQVQRTRGDCAASGRSYRRFLETAPADDPARPRAERHAAEMAECVEKAAGRGAGPAPASGPAPPPADQPAATPDSTLPGSPSGPPGPDGAMAGLTGAATASSSGTTPGGGSSSPTVPAAATPPSLAPSPPATGSSTTAAAPPPGGAVNRPPAGRQLAAAPSAALTADGKSARSVRPPGAPAGADYPTDASSWWTGRNAGYGLMGAGLAAGVTALILTVQAARLDDEITNGRKVTLGEVDGGKSKARWARILGGTAAALSGAGVTLWLLSPPPARAGAPSGSASDALPVGFALRFNRRF